MTALLQDGVAYHAHIRPEATAIVHLRARMTYGELDHAGTRVASALREIGCRRGDRVCLLMPKSLSAIVGILGILKADCLYVPLDPSSPAARLRKMIDQAEPSLILASGPVMPTINNLLADRDTGEPPLRVGWMGPEPPEGHTFAPTFTWSDCTSLPAKPVVRRAQPDDPAYIMFTSGSTGVPKGVVITHANVLHFLRWATGYFGTTAADRISGHPPLHFDLSVFDIFGAFLAGAELHLVPPELNLLPHKLADFIRASALTQWFSVPSILKYMAKFDVVKPGDFPSLKRILWCGEAFPTPSLIYWMARVPHAAFTNLYGPTETTIASSYYTVPACPDTESAAIPIGRPCEGEELLVLDDALNQVPPGEIGDLYIRGVGMGLGYWRDPEKTQSAFVPDPSAPDERRLYKTGDLAQIGEDGLVYFHGRADGQIKSRGYRIELGEIEAALHMLPGLADVAVVAVPADGFEGMTICCAYVPAAEVDTAHVRKELATLLPAYMVPTQWRAYQRLPVNASGKIDRPRLRADFLVLKKGNAS